MSRKKISLRIFCQIPDAIGGRKKKDTFPIEEASILHFYHTDCRVSTNLGGFFSTAVTNHIEEERHRDKSVRLDRENAIVNASVVFVAIPYYFRLEQRRLRLKSRCRQDHAVLATTRDVIKRVHGSGFRSRCCNRIESSSGYVVDDALIEIAWVIDGNFATAVVCPRGSKMLQAAFFVLDAWWHVEFIRQMNAPRWRFIW